MGVAVGVGVSTSGGVVAVLVAVGNAVGGRVAVAGGADVAVGAGGLVGVAACLPLSSSSLQLVRGASATTHDARQ